MTKIKSKWLTKIKSKLLTHPVLKNPKHNSKCKQFLTTGQKKNRLTMPIDIQFNLLLWLIACYYWLGKNTMISYFSAFHRSVKIKCFKDLYLHRTSTITLSLLGMKLHSFITPLSASNSAKFYKNFAITTKNHQALYDIQNVGTQGFQRIYQSQF